MSELQEKRDYYEDRSLKAVYFVDKQGQKQGDYTEYEQNSDSILNKLEYKDDAVWNGKVNTTDGYIIYKNGEKSKEFKTNFQRYDYDYNCGKLRRQKGTELDFPFVDCVETETIENGKSIETKTFYYESTRYNGGPCSRMNDYLCNKIAREKYINPSLIRDRYPSNNFKHKLIHQTSYKNNVRIDKIEKATRYTDDGVHKWLDMGYCTAWTCIFENGELKKYSDNEGYNASFEKGVPIGDYKMPLNKYGLAFYDAPCAIKTGEDLIDKISIPMLDSTKTFNLSDKEMPTSIVVEGTWNNGKFTGKTISKHFYVKWDNGKMTGNFHTDALDYHWHDGVCDVVERSKNATFKYTLCNGKKDGISRKYNKEGWLESETQYKNGEKHGFEKLYESNGTVAEMKYWQNGKDCTAKYNKLKNIATKRIEKEKAIEAETGKKTRLPKMSKLEKAVAMVKENLGLSK